MTADADDRVVANDELEADDRAALGWAVSEGHRVGLAILERVRAGGSGVTTGELAVIRADWEAHGRPVADRHVHRSPVTLADGSRILAVSFDQNDPYARESTPAFGLYLDQRWNPPWAHDHVQWPDFGLPADLDAFRSALVALLERARCGEVVEVGCLGGHGRTGTALGCLAVLAGTPAAEAVGWVRANYCGHAVETAAQAELVSTFEPGN